MRYSKDNIKGLIFTGKEFTQVYEITAVDDLKISIKEVGTAWFTTGFDLKLAISYLNDGSWIPKTTHYEIF